MTQQSSQMQQQQQQQSPLSKHDALTTIFLNQKSSQKGPHGDFNYNSHPGGFHLNDEPNLEIMKFSTMFPYNAIFTLSS